MTGRHASASANTQGHSCRPHPGPFHHAYRNVMWEGGRASATVRAGSLPFFVTNS